MEPRTAAWTLAAPAVTRRGFLLWALAAGAAALAVGSAAVVAIHALRTGDTRSLLSHQAILPLVTLGFAALGALVASRARHPVGWLLLVVGVLSGLTLAALAGRVTFPAGTDTGALPGWRAGLMWLELWLWVPSTFLPTTFVFLYFPDGKLPSRGWRIVALAAWAGLIGTTVGLMAHPGPVPYWSEGLNPWGLPALAPTLAFVVHVGGGLSVATLLASMALVITRYLGSHGVRREQLRWMVAAAGVLGLNLAIAAVVTFAYPGDRLATEAAMALTSLGMLAIATAAAIAILRHRLYGIDVLLDRTLVYASLTAAVLALYLLVVGAVGALAGPQDNLLVALVATGLVAALVLPLRDRLQHGVNRLMYGERDDPHALLSRLGRRLEATAAPDTVLVTVAESVARALRLPYAAVALRYDEGSETAAAYGRSAGPLLAFPITHGDERVGELLVAPRPGETTLSDAERPLLETIARQAGVAAHGVRLTTDLRRSRERLVASREEERRRMRRDLHDGLGPALAAMALKVEAARNYLAGTGGPAPELLSQLAEEIDQAAAGIRRLMYGLRPPALDDLGLVGALRVQAGLHEGPELRIEVCAPEALPPLPAAVEVAAYRISQEALTNVVRHAHAGHCRVTLEVDERLCLTVEDDGRGLPSRVRTGVGLRSIRERATELGGSVDIATRRSSGTRVSAWIPLGEGA